MIMMDRIGDLKQRAVGLHERGQGRDEAARLQRLLEEARGLSSDLGREAQQLHLLRDQGIVLPSEELGGEDADAALKVLDRLRERFAQERRATRLTQRQDWTRFTEWTEAARKQAAGSLDKAWRDFVDGEYKGDKPDHLKGSLAPTDFNTQRLQRYRIAYDELVALKRKRPAAREDFDRVRELARLLNETHAGFNFDVPDAVNHFLRAIATGGADLDLLTDEVRAWLQQQGSIDRYQIALKRTAS